MSKGFISNNLKATVDNDVINTTFDIENIANYRGKEIIQIYFDAPTNKIT